jgi:hypothetical protein
LTWAGPWFAARIARVAIAMRLKSLYAIVIKKERKKSDWTERSLRTRGRKRQMVGENGLH